jgi:hypothetical protein
MYRQLSQELLTDLKREAASISVWVRVPLQGCFTSPTCRFLVWNSRTIKGSSLVYSSPKFDRTYDTCAAVLMITECAKLQDTASACFGFYGLRHSLVTADTNELNSFRHTLQKHMVRVLANCRSSLEFAETPRKC